MTDAAETIPVSDPDREPAQTPHPAPASSASLEDEPPVAGGLDEGMNALQAYWQRLANCGRTVMRAAGEIGSPLSPHDMKRRQGIIDAYAGKSPGDVLARRNRARFALQALKRSQRARRSRRAKEA